MEALSIPHLLILVMILAYFIPTIIAVVKNIGTTLSTKLTSINSQLR